jgi:hypothetical protein
MGGENGPQALTGPAPEALSVSGIAGHQGKRGSYPIRGNPAVQAERSLRGRGG